MEPKKTPEPAKDTIVCGFVRHPRKPAKFRVVYPTKKFARDDHGKVIVVDGPDRDIQKETQSHAHQVGIDNLIQTLPDGTKVVAGTTGLPSMTGDFTKVPKFVSDIPSPTKFNASRQWLDEMFGKHDWEKVSDDDLTKMIKEKLALTNGKEGDSNAN